MTHATGPAADALERCRDQLNAEFLSARRAGAAIDPEAFLEHLASIVAPIVDAVAKERPERTVAILRALFAVSIELFSASGIGPDAKGPTVMAVWSRLLPNLIRLVAQDPRRVAASLSNAAFNISQTPGARADAWISGMTRLGRSCQSVSDLLGCGKVLAWRAALPQYRAGAIATARLLPSELAAASLDLPTGMEASMVEVILDRLASDPWFDPVLNLWESGFPALVGCVGNFRGFGGEFLRPPHVWQSDDHLCASDGDATWTVFADHYGQLLMRGGDRETANTQTDVTLAEDGTIEWNGDRVRFPAIAGATSWASDTRTLAVTIPTSHHVFLVARVTGRSARETDNAA